MIARETPSLPDERGRFGDFGGKFVPETLMAALAQLEAAYRQVQGQPAFQSELEHLLHTYAGRPTPLYYAQNLTRQCGGAKIYLKREDLAHTGAHKINNALGQALLAKHMGKDRIIAETGAGQHGVASATACAMLGLQCIVYMGAEDVRRQSLNVFRMGLLGADLDPRRVGHPHPEGRHQRGHTGLGDQRGDNSLSYRQRCWPPPLPHAGPRLPSCHRQRSSGPVLGSRRPPARLRRGLRRRRQQRHRSFSPIRWRPVREAGGSGSRRQRSGHR